MTETNMYQDTLAPCNRYNNPITDDYKIYQKQMRQVNPSNIDRYIDSETAKEKEMIEQMMFNLIGKQNGQILLLGQLCKYLFFNIMLKPFLIVFKMPKWLRQHGMPKALEVMAKATDFLKQITEGITNSFKSIDKRIGDFLKATTSSVSDAISELAAKMKLGEAYSTLQGMLAHIASLHNSFIKTTANTFESFQKSVAHLFKSSLEKIQNLYQKPLKQVEEFLNNLVENGEKFLKNFFEKITTPINKTSEYLKNGWENMQQKIADVINPPINLILENYKRLSNIISDLSDTFDEGVSKVEKKFKKKVEEVNNFISENVNKVTHVINLGITQMILQPTINFYTTISTFGNNSLNRTKNRWYSMVARTKAMIQKFKDKFHSLKRWLYEQIQRIKKTILWIFDKFIEYISKFYLLFLVFLTKIIAFSKTVIRKIMVLFSITKLMFRYTFLLLKESFK